MRAEIKSAAIGLVLLSATLVGQQAPHDPQFEVATIKPAPPVTPAMIASGRTHFGMKIDRDLVDIGYSSLSDLIRMAYDVQPYQNSGPDWLSQDKWDVLAKMPDNALARDADRMLQVLLADRFKLRVSVGDSLQHVYALEIADGGSKLREGARSQPAGTNSPAGPSSKDDEDSQPLRVATNREGNVSTVSGGLAGTTRTEMRADGSMHYVSTKMTLELLAALLSAYMDRPVIDNTGSKGMYQVELDFSPEDLRFAAAKGGAGAYYGAAAAPADSGVSLFSSIHSLGLRLERRDAPLKTVTVISVEKTPTAN